MTKEEFRKLADRAVLFLDGATGSILQKRGMPAGVCPEKWILENPNVMIGLQREYVEAGSNIIYAPTFTANRMKLKEYGLEEQIKEINQELIAISKEAVGKNALVAADITMTGEQLEPIGTMKFNELIEVYKEQIKILDDAKADLLVIETMMSLAETRAALIAAKEVSQLPVMVTMSFNEDGRTLYGTEPETAVVVLQSLGADAIGVNCSAGPDRMIPIIKKMKAYATVPLIAKPNAGLPRLGDGGQTEYDMNEIDFAKYMIEIVKAGANIVGGCCGTSPNYIKNLYTELKDLDSISPVNEAPKAIATERKSFRVDIQKEFILGEKIDTTVNEELLEELLEGEYDTIMDLAEEQDEEEINAINIKVKVEGADEKEIMIQAMIQVSQFSSKPISFQSDDLEVLEEVIRQYPGRGIIRTTLENSEKAKELTKKYGSLYYHEQTKKLQDFNVVS